MDKLFVADQFLPWLSKDFLSNNAGGNPAMDQYPIQLEGRDTSSRSMLY